MPYSDIAQHVAAGTAKVLFTNGPKRVRQLPDVQAVSERFPGFYFWSWYGIAAPGRTPALVVEKLRKELTTLAKSPDFVTKLGLAPVDEPEKLGEVISKEIAQWQQLVVELQLPRI
ncbi:MAG TPA: tripartite tricarboxylate transporter substrate-binding protein [Pseudolabrys sp.]|nr:tripartite tricarboxylate transporter substrate-binding protein [Pseudolabrys sp.]